MTDLIELDMDWHDQLPPDGRAHLMLWAKSLPDVPDTFLTFDGNRPAVTGIRIRRDDSSGGEIELTVAGPPGPGRLDPIRVWMPVEWSEPFPMSYVEGAASTSIAAAPGPGRGGVSTEASDAVFELVAGARRAEMEADDWRAATMALAHMVRPEAWDLEGFTIEFPESVLRRIDPSIEMQLYRVEDPPAHRLRVRRTL